MTYSVYFSTNENGCYHPINLPGLSRDDAFNAAIALVNTLPIYFFGYGPLYNDGLVKVYPDKGK